MREELTKADKIVVIDGIQKPPSLLDEVQLLIDARGTRFLLTGSSARKLRRGHVNLLGGRAATATLHPFVSAAVARKTVHEYFQILKDTLLAYELPAWQETVKRKPVQVHKFYFFDVGVARALQGGGALPYWRSKAGFEVDFILSGRTAIEIKATRHVSPQDLKGLRAIAEEGKIRRLICVRRESDKRSIDGIEILPWRLFLKRLWDNEY